MDKHKGILSIDFDDTIAKTSYPAISGPVKDSKKYINQLYDDGWYIIVWTCRDDTDSPYKPMSMARQWMETNGYKFHQFNEHNEMLIKYFGNNTRKIAADIYIDDKNIFGMKSWRKMYNEISKYDPAKSVLRRCEV